MGSCMSRSGTAGGAFPDDQDIPCANVVLIDGDLRRFPVPIAVSQVLQSETMSSAFVCNSDRLYFDDYIPALDPQDELEPGQIYFVLPLAKLHYRLSASDMASLAVKASVALQTLNNKRRKNHKARISPMLVHVQEGHQQYLPPANHSHVHSVSDAYGSNYSNNNTAKKKRPSALGVSRSVSVKKLQRYSSQRAKLAVRSFKIRLTTIYEGSILLVN